MLIFLIENEKLLPISMWTDSQKAFLITPPQVATLDGLLFWLSIFVTKCENMKFSDTIHIML